ncbi:5108_t:CDS:2 [Dentiscutata erythropus]|uniref:5108_t:CDS:1 n=1 Tax=Dentiscutata erythropus TaxID=1348616 RepID=A0A9N9GYB9_9GLOM|nr:5108_t:CDS:2 [Dentiscutata erythropus]
MGLSETRAFVTSISDMYRSAIPDWNAKTKLKATIWKHNDAVKPNEYEKTDTDLPSLPNIGVT